MLKLILHPIGKTTLLQLLAGKYMVGRDAIRVLGRSPFYDLVSVQAHGAKRTSSLDHNQSNAKTGQRPARSEQLTLANSQIATGLNPHKVTWLA